MSQPKKEDDNNIQEHKPDNRGVIKNGRGVLFPKVGTCTSRVIYNIKKCVRVTKPGREGHDNWHQHQAKYREMHIPEILLS